MPRFALPGDTCVLNKGFAYQRVTQGCYRLIPFYAQCDNRCRSLQQMPSLPQAEQMIWMAM